MQAILDYTKKVNNIPITLTVFPLPIYALAYCSKKARKMEIPDTRVIQTLMDGKVLHSLLTTTVVILLNTAVGYD
jgi:hypothetical protein